MLLRCADCGAKHALDDRLADRPTAALCPECGHRCDVQGPLPPAAFVVKKPSGETVEAGDVASVQAMLATGIVGPEDTLVRAGMRSVTLAELTGFGPFFSGKTIDRATPPYGTRVRPSSSAPPSGRMSMGTGAPSKHTIRPAGAPIATPPLPPVLAPVAAPSSSPPRGRAVSVDPIVPSTAPTANDTTQPRASERPRDAAGGGSRFAWTSIAAAAIVVFALGTSTIVRGLGDRRAAAHVQELVGTGKAALAAGRLESAKESFDKAEGMSPTDPSVLLGAARVAVAQADEAWLRERLVSSDAPEERRLLARSRSELAARADRLATRARAGAPDDEAILLVSASAMRLAGDVERARDFTARAKSAAASADADYARAMIALATEGRPSGETIEALRRAAVESSTPVLARALYAYALAEQGDRAGARAECEKLSRLTDPPASLGPLRAWLDRSEAAPPPAAAAPTPPLASGRATPPAPARVDHLRRGDAELRAGRLDRARKHYEEALRESEGRAADAHVGLARVAEAEGDREAARKELEAALAIDPHSARAQELLDRVEGADPTRPSPAGRGVRPPPNTAPDPH